MHSRDRESLVWRHSAGGWEISWPASPVGPGRDLKGLGQHLLEARGPMRQHLGVHGREVRHPGAEAETKNIYE